MLCSNKVSTLDLCTILSPTFKVNPEFCTTVVDLWYLSSKFISIKEDVGNNSVLASSRKLQELNNSVTISSIPSSLAKERLSDFQDVVFTDISLDKAREYNDYCHSHQPLFAFLTFEVCGLIGEVFCDFDLNFTVFDVDGDLVVFSEVHGMTEFNDGNAGFDALDVLYRHRQQKALPSGEDALSRVDINTDEEDVNVMKGTVRAPSPPFTTVWIMKHKDMHWAISPIGSVPITATLSRPLGRNQQQMWLTKRANTWEPTKHVVEYVLFYAHIGNFFDRGVAVRVLDPRSYTREDVGEIQGNGSAVCMQRLLRARIHGGARLAQLDDAAQAFVHFMKACVNLNQGAAFIKIKESDSLIDSNLIKWCNAVAGKFQLLYMTPTAGKFQLFFNLYAKSLEIIPRQLFDNAKFDASVVLYKRVLQSGFDGSPFVQSSLVNLYSRCNEITDARKVFDETPDKNVVAWSAMISGYAKGGLVNEGLSLFREIQEAGVKPAEVTMVSVISVYAVSGALELGKWVHTFLSKHMIEIEVEVSTALVAMYATCGCTEKAKDIFEAMHSKDTKAWSSMIVGFAIHDGVTAPAAGSKQGHELLLFETRRDDIEVDVQVLVSWKGTLLSILEDEALEGGDLLRYVTTRVDFAITEGSKEWLCNY